MKPNYKNLGLLIYFSKLQRNMCKTKEHMKPIIVYTPPKKSIIVYTPPKKSSSIKQL